MKIVLQQVLILYIFLLVGWFLGKRNKEQAARTGILSYLLVNFFLPCKIIHTFSEQFTIPYLKEQYVNILIATGLMLVLHLLSLLVSKWFTKDAYQRKVYQYSLVVSNYAYMGYGLVEGIFGSAGLMDFIVFCIPMSLYIYVYGYALLTGGGFSWKKLCNPLMISIVICIVFGLTGITLPGPITKVMSGASACLSPISMILTGMTLSTLTVKDLIKDKASYIFVLMRLLALPALVALCCKLFGMSGLANTAVVYAALPSGMNVVVFPKLVGEDATCGAKLVFLSNLFSCITIPICMALFL